MFAGMFRKKFHDTLIIPVHEVAKVNHKSIINEGFHRYLKKLQKIKSVYKVSLHQWLQVVLFAIYVWNTGPVDVNYIDQSVVSIGRELPFTIYLSPSISSEGTS